MESSTVIVEIGMPITEETVWPEYPPTQRVEVGGEISISKKKGNTSNVHGNQ